MKLLRIFALALPIAVGAQGAPTTQAGPILQAGGAFFALSVSDMDASVRWYREKLGLTVIMQFPRTDESKSAATVLQGGGLTVELVKHDDAVPLRNFLPEPRGALYVSGRTSRRTQSSGITQVTTSRSSESSCSGQSA